MKLPMPEFEPGPYVAYVSFDEFRRRIMISFGYAAGYDGRSPNDNPGKSADEQAWWLEGWNRGAAIFDVVQVRKAPPAAIAPASRPVESVVRKPRNLF